MASHKTPAYHALQSAGKISSHLTRNLLSQKDNFLASILYDWPLIIGEKYAYGLKPERISFPKTQNSGATLHLSVTTGSMALMAHHLQPLILDKVNQFVGYHAFEKITLHHSKHSSSGSPSLPSSLPHQLTDTEAKELESLLRETPEGSLKEALKKLGESLYLQKETFP